VSGSALRRIGCASNRPTVSAGIVSAAGIEITPRANAAPDDHLITGPDRRVRVSPGGRVGSAGGRPTVSAGIVSAPSIRIDER
jgi:hypothetical protein